MTNLGEVIPASLHWLESQELVYENTFFNSLILICLEDLPGNEKIVQKGIEFIKNQQSPAGSWNYWDRNSASAQRHPFPDDLDDTAYALMALSVYEPSYVDGVLLAKLAKLLIANEIKPGGPYRTWLVGPALYAQWGDTDLGVNANIGSLLAHHGVSAPGLKEYVSQQLASDDRVSRYYVGEVPPLYFLSRWYHGDDLKQIVKRQFQDLKHKSDMELAMLLTAGCRLKIASNVLEQASQQLIANIKNGHWAAANLYLELTVKGTAHYASSAALTTAFALEALALYQKLAPPPEAKMQPKPASDISRDIVKSSRGMPLKLRQDYLKLAQQMIAAGTKGQITNMSGLTAQAFGLNIDPRLCGWLNQASLDGWIAYTVYDDFYDDEARPGMLSVANHALRQAVRGFQSAVPDPAFVKLVYETFDIIDAANQWEVQYARGQIEENKLTYQLPDYGDYSKLAERSWGHMLAATGTLVAARYKLGSTEVVNLQKFFHHYLIARQLNDDAHDWQEDLQNGHLSSVVTLLLQEYNPTGPINLRDSLKDLQIHFWQHTINAASLLINRHLQIARKSLKASNMTDKSIFGNWLDGLEEATNQALKGSQEAQKFIKTYQHNSNNKIKY